MATIQELEERLNSFEQSLLQMQRNLVPQTAKVDNTAVKVEEITPYTKTKTAYIDDTDIIFENVPNGAMLISFSNGNLDYTVTKENGNLIINFAPLEEVTEVTLTIN